MAESKTDHFSFVFNAYSEKNGISDPLSINRLLAPFGIRCTQASHEVGLIGPMSKADAADNDSTLRKHRQRGLIPWKPGQSGNPKGRPPGSRNKLAEDFFRDLCDAWAVFGKPALTTAAFLHPLEFVRLDASLMPRELEPTATVTKRMSDAQIDAIIARGSKRP